MSSLYPSALCYKAAVPFFDLKGFVSLLTIMQGIALY